MNLKKEIFVENERGRFSELSPFFKVVIQKKSNKCLRERNLTSRETRKSPTSEKKERKNLKIQKFRFLQLEGSPIHSSERLNFSSRTSSSKKLSPFLTNSFLSTRLNFSKIKIVKRKNFLRQNHVFPNKKMMVIGRNLLSRQND